MPTEVRIVRIQLEERAHTRELLAIALGVHPDALEISHVCGRCGDPTHGRPFLVSDGPAFNVSHTEGLAVVALAQSGALVGVDIEQIRPRPKLAALARRVLDVEAYAEWREAPDQLEVFLRAWTEKEAYLKALGIGVATRLAEVPAAVDGWTIVPIDVGHGYVGSVAVNRPGVIPSVGTAD